MNTLEQYGVVQFGKNAANCGKFVDSIRQRS